MPREILIQLYNESYKDKWDLFVLRDSANGTFLQTRNFFDYHPADRFCDHSLLFMNGNNIIAVLPAHLQIGKKKVLNSHQGSTFGGLIVGKNFFKIRYMDLIFEKLDSYIKENKFEEIILKQSGGIYQKVDTELIDYYFFINGYSDTREVGYYIDYNSYDRDVIKNFTSSTRRDYRYSLNNNLVFKELLEQKEIGQFYDILCDNYAKFGKWPVHTLDELIDFKFSRLKDNTRFYGVFHDAAMVAGGMIFLFDKRVFHTQYLAVLQNMKNMFINEFLYKNLIEVARMDGFELLSLGTSTLQGGRVLNRSLAQFKEGFGTKEYVNRTYKKVFLGQSFA